MTWTDWYQTDLPCQYSPIEALDARRYLEEVLGLDFLRDSTSVRKAQPLVRQWKETGANSFLQMNGLAEDLRLLRDRPGINSVLADLRDERLCLPTWHLLHTAALFERARPGAVLEFVEADDDERPDAIVEVAGRRVPLEAKLLMQSEDETRFHRAAKKLDEALAETLSAIRHPTALYVVLKQAPSDSIEDSAIADVKNAAVSYTGEALTHRSDLLNVFLEPVALPSGLSDFKIFYVLAPVPDTENLRVVGRAKKASRQLRSLSSIAQSGLLSIGLTDNQDAASVFDQIRAQIGKGKLRGVAGVLLVKRRTHLGLPQRANLDLLEFRPNSSAKDPLPGIVPLRPSGLAGLLTQVERPIGGVRAYRFGVSRGRIGDPTRAAQPLPDLRILRPDDLR